MSSFDPRYSPMLSETLSEDEGPVACRAPTRLVTTSGVTVLVKPAPPPPENEEPPFSRPAKRVVIRPPERAIQERDALMRRLVEEHGAWICRRLTRLIGKDIPEESVKDLQQRVLVVLGTQVEADGPPEHVRGFLAHVIRNVLSNHKRRWKPDIDADADADAALWSAPDPEEAVAFIEDWARFQRYLTYLPDAEAEVIRCVDLDGMTIDAAATMLRRPRGTVSTQLTRAREKIEGFAQDSEQGGGLGERLRRR